MFAVWQRQEEKKYKKSFATLLKFKFLITFCELWSRKKTLLITLPTKRPFAVKIFNYEKSNGLIYKLILVEKCVHKFLYLFLEKKTQQKNDVNINVFRRSLEAKWKKVEDGVKENDRKKNLFFLPARVVLKTAKDEEEKR